MIEVSIIITLYNAEKYIEETILSAINQTYKNKEIIVIDDGSTDNSSKIVKKYLDENIRYYYQENRGVAVARNKGIKLAKGNYISFLDSDDILYKDKIQKQIEQIKKDDSDACYCGYNNWYDKSNKKEVKKMIFKKGKIIEFYLNENTIPQTCTWIINKNILNKQKIQFTEKCNWGEDLEFFSKILLYSNVTFVEEELMDYRIREVESLSSKFKLTYDDIIMWERLKIWINEQNISFKEKETYLNIIDRYRINRTYVDNMMGKIKLKQSITNEIKYLDKVKFKLCKKDMKLYIKKIYVLCNFKVQQSWRKNNE